MFKGRISKGRLISSIALMLVSITIVKISFLGNGIFDFLPYSPKENSSYNFVQIIDVGQGDSILLYSDGYSALIDTGISDESFNVCECLDSYGINNLDVLLITHLDADHAGGIDRITQLYGIKNLILPELSVESEGLTAAELAINRIAKSGGEIYTAVQGMNFDIGEIEVTVLANYSKLSSENDRSIIAMAKIDGFKFLLTGDAQLKAEKELLKDGIDISCDVLKVGHHGSSTSSSEEFIKAASPRFAAISVGADNSYGHPHKEVLATLEYVGAKVYRTDYSGNIIFYVSDGKLKVKTEK